MNKSVICTLGRFQPITIGHLKLLKKVFSLSEEQDCKGIIYTSSTFDDKKNPLSFEEKIELISESIYDNNLESRLNVSDAKGMNYIKILKDLDGQYNNVTIVVGSDRIPEVEKLVYQYNGKEYNFDNIEVVSSGERDEDADEVSAMSASKIRKYVKDNDIESFLKSLGFSNEDLGLKTFNTIRQRLHYESMDLHKLFSLREDEVPAQPAPKPGQITLQSAIVAFARFNPINPEHTEFVKSIVNSDNSFKQSVQAFTKKYKVKIAQPKLYIISPKKYNQTNILPLNARTEFMKTIYGAKGLSPIKDKRIGDSIFIGADGLLEGLLAIYNSGVRFIHFVGCSDSLKEEIELINSGNSKIGTSKTKDPITGLILNPVNILNNKFFFFNFGDPIPSTNSPFNKKQSDGEKSTFNTKLLALLKKEESDRKQVAKKEVKDAEKEPSKKEEGSLYKYWQSLKEDVVPTKPDTKEEPKENLNFKEFLDMMKGLVVGDVKVTTEFYKGYFEAMLQGYAGKINSKGTYDIKSVFSAEIDLAKEALDQTGIGAFVDVGKTLVNAGKNIKNMPKNLGKTDASGKKIGIGSSLIGKDNVQKLGQDSKIPGKE